MEDRVCVCVCGGELFMIFSSFCMSSYQAWKWVCWKLANVQTLLSAYRTWWIKANHSRQTSPPFMLIHPPQLWLWPSPAKRDGRGVPLSGPFRCSHVRCWAAGPPILWHCFLFGDSWQKRWSVQKQESCDTLLQPYSHQDCSIKRGLPLPLQIFSIQKS